MTDGNAMRPGDVIKSMSGKTIEVLNTDAEGRLVLADIATYAIQNYKPSAIIDLATLTGAILVALGQEMAGLFCNNDELADNLINSGKKTGELLWRMPIDEKYMKILTKEFVDSWRNQIINIHPSLLPAYKGLNTHKRVLNDGVQLAGCTTHIVERELDSGQILMQATVPVLKDDTEDALAKRILRMEHIIFPETLKRIATNQFRFDK